MPVTPASIIEAFLNHCAQNPVNLCLKFEGREITYGQVKQAVIQLTASLTERGLKPGDRVALFLENCPEFIVIYLAGQPGAVRAQCCCTAI